MDESTGVEARDVAEEIRIKREAQLLDRSVHGAGATVTFLEAAVAYMEVTPSRNERRLVGRLVDYFGTKPLQQIEQREVEACAEALYPHASPGTVRRNCAAPIQAVLNRAERVFRGYRAPRIDKRKWVQSKGRLRWITPDEAETLLRAASDRLRPLVLFQLYTGCRLGEALKLTWDDVNLVAETVLFRKTKNGEDRLTPLPAKVVEELLQLPRPNESARVFWQFKANHEVYYDWHPAVKAAGLSDYLPHDNCHTFATWLRQYGGADARALLETGRWKAVGSVMRYMHAPGAEVRERLAKLPELGKNPGSKVGSGA